MSTPVSPGPQRPTCSINTWRSEGCGSRRKRPALPDVSGEAFIGPSGSRSSPTLPLVSSLGVNDMRLSRFIRVKRIRFVNLRSTQGRAVERLAVGLEDLEVVDSRCCRVAVLPDDLLVAGDFGKLDVISLGVMAGDDGVAVREPLDAAGVVDRST